MNDASIPLPLNQLAFSVIDLKTTERWWREGLGFLPAGGNPSAACCQAHMHVH